MNSPRPFVVLPFPQRGQEFVSIRETTKPTNGRTMRASARQMAKRDRHESAARYFQNIHGLVNRGRHHAPQFVACATGRGVPVDQTVR
jgi:hypothetical protein